MSAECELSCLNPAHDLSFVKKATVGPSRVAIFNGCRRCLLGSREGQMLAGLDEGFHDRSVGKDRAKRSSSKIGKSSARITARILSSAQKAIRLEACFLWINHFLTE
jgi:hypothetical protein